MKNLLAILFILILSSALYAEDNRILFSPNVKDAVDTKQLKQIYLGLGYDKYWYDQNSHQREWEKFVVFWNKAENAFHENNYQEGLVGKRLLCKTKEKDFEGNIIKEHHIHTFVPSSLVVDSQGIASRKEAEILSLRLQDTSELPYLMPGHHYDAIILGMLGGHVDSDIQDMEIQINKLGSDQYLAIDRETLEYSYTDVRGDQIQIGKCELYNDRWVEHHGHAFNYLDNKVGKELYKNVLKHIKKNNKKKENRKL